MIQNTDDLFNDDAHTDADRFLYHGDELDVEAGLQYSQARHYDPTVGRWINQDPIGYEAGDANPEPLHRQPAVQRYRSHCR